MRRRDETDRAERNLRQSGFPIAQRRVQEKNERRLQVGTDGGTFSKIKVFTNS